MLTLPPYPASRPRRLRRDAWSRDLVRETRLHPSDLILPVFVLEGSGKTQDVSSMPGVQRVSLDRLLPQFGISGLSEDDLVHVNLGWHRLKPWPDAVPGLTRLKSKFIIGPLSNGNLSLLVDLAKFGGLPWDTVFGSDLFGHYKPDPETYLGVARLLDLPPGRVMMAAAHNNDLLAAQNCGLMTAFFARPTEYGPHQKRDYEADGKWDFVARDIEDLASQLGC